MTNEHDILIRVPYCDTDAMGIVHHANYLNYFETGRTELLRQLGTDYRRMEASGMFMVVVQVECRYRRPARYDDLLKLRTTTTRVTAAKIEHAYRLFRDDELLAEGRSTLACVDRQGIPQRVPEWLHTT